LEPLVTQWLAASGGYLQPSSHARDNGLADGLNQDCRRPFVRDEADLIHPTAILAQVRADVFGVAPAQRLKPRRHSESDLLPILLAGNRCLQDLANVELQHIIVPF